MMFYAFNFRKIRKKLIIAVILSVLMFAGYTAFKTVYPLKYMALINEYSKKYGLEPTLVCAVIHAESRFNPNALSNKGASGLMQLMKQTADWGAEEIGLAGYDYLNIFEPKINIELGCWYLAKLLEQFRGNEKTALAAYNAGSGNVSKWLDDSRYSSDGENLSEIPFGQTKRYIGKIEQGKRVYRFVFYFFPD